MTLKGKLLKPLPPGVDPTHPHIIAVQIQQHREAINHLQDVKLELPHSSWLPLIGVTSTAILGVLGLVSPEQVAQILRLFVR